MADLVNVLAAERTLSLTMNCTQWNMLMSHRGLFVTGTDTEVGKTYVTAMIARQLVAQGHRVGAYKPCASGSVADAQGREVWQDVETLASVVNVAVDEERICPQRFRAPAAPPVAARLENKHVDPQLLRAGAQWWENRADVLLVEGVGGFLCPLTESETIADLAVDLRFPLIIVGQLGLGTINHTLLTIEAVRARGLTIAGIILNEARPCAETISAQSNPQELQARTDVRLLGVIDHGKQELRLGRERVSIDWLGLAHAP